jgi:hypothetical protein
VFDKFSFGHFAVIDPDIIIAVRVGANPGLVSNFGSLPPIIGQGQQQPLIAFKTLWIVFHFLSFPNYL